MSFENTVQKGEIACNEQFLLYPYCFLQGYRPFCNFHQIYSCCLQTLSVWKSLKFVIWERVKWKIDEYVSVAQSLPYKTSKQEVTGLTLAWPIFFPKIDESCCDMIHSSLSASYCFDDSDVGKQPVTWKEYFS